MYSMPSAYWYSRPSQLLNWLRPLPAAAGSDGSGGVRGRGASGSSDDAAIEGWLTAVELHSGFTLIELLVVIAVIAILAAMLLPALSKPKAKAQGIMCLNNMRQLSIAWIQYVQDSREFLPYASASGSPGPANPK